VSRPSRRPKRKDPEHQEQAALIHWVHLNLAVEPRLKTLYAIPNGGWRAPSTRMKLMAEGVKEGVPDLCLPLSSRQTICGPEWGSLYIEMKAKNRYQSIAQRQFVMDCADHGPVFVVCHSWIEAAHVLVQYLHPSRLRAPEWPANFKKAPIQLPFGPPVVAAA